MKDKDELFEETLKVATEESMKNYVLDYTIEESMKEYIVKELIKVSNGSKHNLNIDNVIEQMLHDIKKTNVSNNFIYLKYICYGVINKLFNIGSLGKTSVNYFLNNYSYGLPLEKESLVEMKKLLEAARTTKEYDILYLCYKTLENVKILHSNRKGTFGRNSSIWRLMIEEDINNSKKHRQSAPLKVIDDINNDRQEIHKRLSLKVKPE